MLKVNQATIVTVDPTALFSIATTLMSRGGHYSDPLIASDTYLIILSVEQGGVKYHFFCL